MINIFTNPIAGKGKALKVTRKIEKILSEKGISFISFTTNWPDNLEDCSEVWIVGGDGTINYFLNKYHRLIMPIACFKGGTGNDIAWVLYGKQTLAEQVDNVLIAKPKPVDAALCNGKIFLNIVGIGFDGAVLKSLGKKRSFLGHLIYLWVVYKKVLNFHEYSYSIRTDTERFEGPRLLVSISNASRTGGGFHIAPQARVNDGQLDLIMSDPLSVRDRLKYLPVIRSGRHLSLPFISHRLLEGITVEAETEVPAQMDGELIRHKRFDITLLPGYCRIKY